MKTNRFLARATLLALLSTFSLQLSALPSPLGTAFTYQGKLTDGGPAANGLYDFEFTLYDAATGGNHVAPTLPIDSVGVTNGLFTVTLDFGPGVFLGEERWLETAVRPSGTGGFARFPARQRLTPAPYALHAAQAGIAASVTDNSVTAQGLSTLAPPAAGQVLTFDGTTLAWSSPSAAGNAWLLGGNTGTTPATQFIGTTDNQPLEFKVNGQRALRLERNEISGDPDIYGLTPTPNIIGGSWLNSVASNVVGATIAGGGAQQYHYGLAENKVEADFGTIAGGVLNRIGTFGTNAALGGGFLNRIAGRVGTIAGGQANLIETNAAFAAIGGGLQNDVQASAGFAAIGGGIYNSVALGATCCTIGGGFDNNIGVGTDCGTIGGGRDNAVIAHFGTVSGGCNNLAAGPYSHAAGRRAQALHDGAFVWADSTDADFASTADNEASFRCGGGVRFTSGSGRANQTVSWTPGTASWSFTSDRRMKEGFQPVNSRAVLDKVSRLPIHEWNYIGHRQRHIGPTAQDFHAQFPLNESDTLLNSADLDGVALAAIQGLNQKLETTVQEKDARIADLERRLAVLEELVNTQNK
jgi:hypothetical protein